MAQGRLAVVVVSSWILIKRKECTYISQWNRHNLWKEYLDAAYSVLVVSEAMLEIVD